MATLPKQRSIVVTLWTCDGVLFGGLRDCGWTGALVEVLKLVTSLPEKLQNVPERTCNAQQKAKYIPGRQIADVPSRKYRVTYPNKCIGLGAQR